MEKRESPLQDEKHISPEPGEVIEVEALVNASGHVQELERNFGLVSLGCLAISAGNTWVAAGGAIVSRWNIFLRLTQITRILDGGDIQRRSSWRPL